MKNDISLSQDESVALIETTVDELHERLRGVDANVTVYDAENWAAKEVMAHINGWMEEARICLEAHKRGEQHHATFTHGDEFNREQVAVRSGWSFQDVVDEWLHIHVGICEAIRALSDDEYGKPMMFPWGAVGKIDGFVVHMLEHERGHIDDIVEICGLLQRHEATK